MPLNDQPFIRKGDKVYFEVANDTPGDGYCLGTYDKVAALMTEFLAAQDFGENVERS